MAQSVHIRLELGTPTHSIWCNTCMTSGGFRIPLNRLTDAGVATITHAYGCTTCRVAGRGALDI